MVGYLRGDHTVGQFGDCLLDTVMFDADNDRRIAERATAVSGPRISASRNMVMAAFLRSERTWLWWLDSDMTFNRKVLYRLLEAADLASAPIMGALAFSGGRAWDLEPVLYEPDPELGMKRMKVYPKDSILQVPATGSACLIVHHDVARDVHKLYEDRAHIWYEETSDGKAEFGEDVTFCKRAAEAGHSTFVHTGIEVGHMKMAPLHSGEYARRFMLGAEKKNKEQERHWRALGMIDD